MKKQLCMMVAACGLLSLASCSDDENVIVNDQPIYGDEEQVITLDVQETDILSTKSRPLYSTESKGAEYVSDVVLFVLQEDEGATGNYKIARKIHIDDWRNNSTDYSFGRKYTVKLEGENKLKEGNYVIIAVGQDEDTHLNNANAPVPMEVMTSFTSSFAQSLVQNLEDNYNLYADASAQLFGQNKPGNSFLATDSAKYEVEDRATIPYASSNHAVSEIFSGISKPVSLTTNGTKGFVADVLLKRQVAGVIGYFNNIPAKVEGNNEWVSGTAGDSISVASIRLVASKRYTNIDLAYSLKDQKDDAENVGDEKVVNGFLPTWDGYVTENTYDDPDAWFGAGKKEDNSKAGFVVYQINLAEWFNGGGEDGTTVTYGDEGKTKNSFWSADAYTKGENGDMALLNTSAWKNAYNAGGVNEGDFTVKPGSVFAGEFVIPFDRTPDLTFQLQLMDSSNTVVLKAWDVQLDVASANTDPSVDSETSYNIYRNHLYQIGQRGAGDDGGDDDHDIPQPLDNSQTLMIRINDNWEAIHNMVIE